MSYLYTVLGDNPVGLWPLDAAVSSQFADASGNGNPATVVGGVANDNPVTALGVAGQLLSGSGFTLPVTGFMSTKTQTQPFVFEWWIKPTSTAAGSMTLFKRTTSGITMTGNTIVFSVAMSTTTTLTYTGISQGNPYHCVAYYDGASIGLFVNGSLVGTAEITPTNFAAGFTDVASTLTFSATGGYTGVLDSVAIYNRVINSTMVTDHYTVGTAYNDVQTTSGFNTAHQYRICDANATVLEQIYAATEANWKLGTFSGLTVVNDQLVNPYSDTLAQFQSGTWTDTLIFEAQAVTIVGSRITWNSNITNLTVQVSTNGGTSFSAVTNGSSPIGTQSLAGGLDIVLKISISAGATQTTVSKINFVVYTSKDINGTNSDLPLQIQDPANATIAEFDYNPAQFNLNSGVNLTSATNRLSVATDPAFGGYQALEFTIFIPSTQNSKTVMTSTVASPPTISTNVSGQWTFSNLVALYVDGISIASGTTISNGTFHHVIAVFAAAAGTIYLGNNAAQSANYSCRIGYAATYFTQPSAGTVTQIYTAWVGAAPLRVNDSSVATISEHVLAAGLPVRAYAYNWGNISGG